LDGVKLPVKFAVTLLFLVFLAAFGVFLSNAGRTESILVRFFWWTAFEGPYPNGIALALLAGALVVWIPLVVQVLVLQRRIVGLKRHLNHAPRAAAAPAAHEPPSREPSTPKP
jgi:uncharacterized integral membrane protein